jgi:hypothetical protein
MSSKECGDGNLIHRLKEKWFMDGRSITLIFSLISESCGENP